MLPRRDIEFNTRSIENSLPTEVPIADDITLPELAEPVQREADRRSFLSCPRLSLNLGNIAFQLPSLLNLMSLDGIHPFRSVSSSTKSASPPDSAERSRADRRSRIYAEHTWSATGPSNTGPGSRSEISKEENFSAVPTKFDFSGAQASSDFTPPALGSDGIPGRNFQDIIHAAAQIAANPFQDPPPIDNRIRTPELKPSDPWQFGAAPAAAAATQLSLAGSCSDRRPAPPGTGPRNIGLADPSTFPSSAIATQRPHHNHTNHRRNHLAAAACARPRVVGGQIVTPVQARKVGKLVSGVGSVMSMHAQSEDFSLPDASDEERELRPPPLLVVPRQRSSSRPPPPPPPPQQQQNGGGFCGGRGLRERDTTRRNLFRSSDDGDNDLHGLLRHLGDYGGAGSSSRSSSAAPDPFEEPAGQWSSPLFQGRRSQPETPSTTCRRQSSVLSGLSLTPTALRLAGSSLLRQYGGARSNEDEHSGFSPRQRKVASTHEPLPDSPTLPTVGPQVKMKRWSRRPSRDSF